MAGQKAARKGRLDGSGHGHRDTGRWSRRRRLLAAAPAGALPMVRAQVSRSLDIAPGSISRISARRKRVICAPQCQQ
jgi:hypothetical protein